MIKVAYAADLRWQILLSIASLSSPIIKSLGMLEAFGTANLGVAQVQGRLTSACINYMKIV